MKNYVIRFTRSRPYYSLKPGQYAADGRLGRGTDDLSKAYVFNTRMNRKEAKHYLTAEQQAELGIEVIPVALVLQGALP